MPQGNCYLSIIPAYFSYHTQQPLSSECVLVCVCVCVPAWLIVANVVATYPLQSANIWAPNSPNWHPAHSTISKFPHSNVAPLPPPYASALALILVSAACCYCCSFPPHSLGSLNGQAAVAVAILLCQQSPSPLSTQALNRIKNILCIWYVRWRIKFFYLPWQRKK